jgi:raffinose/stachyose/melibiose transport system permease protein
VTRPAHPMRSPQNWHLRRSRWTIIRYVVLIVFAIVSVFIPLWLVLVNSVKPLGEANALGLNLPIEWKLAENYSTVIDQGKLPLGLVNTLVVVIPSIIGIVLFGALASWVFARSRRRSASLLYYLSISGILIPPAIVTSIQLMKAFTGVGSRVNLILFYMGAFMSFGIFLITGFVKTIPIELEEAARIDGASTLGVFFRIILPLLRPVLVTASFILLIFMWNDFFYAFFFLRGSDQRTLMLGLFNFIGGVEFQVRWNLVFADVMLVSLPLIVLFMIAQRQIVAGLLGAALDK